jgi:signal transduction histidine kinase
VPRARVREDAPLSRLAEEQAALRRVATLVARGAPARNVFALVAEQVGSVLGLQLVSIVRYEADGTATQYASFSERGELFPIGMRWTLDGTSVMAQVRETGRTARIDDYSGLDGTIADIVSRAGVTSTVGIPIVVAGRLWGALLASSMESEPLPANTEAPLAEFTELVATAISNSEAHTELERLAEEQAALRRVATLAARGVAPGDLLGAVAEEVGKLFHADLAGMIRYEDDDTISAVATWAAVGQHADVSGGWSLEGDRLATRMLQTRRPVREDAWHEVGGPIAAFMREELGVRCTVGSPILVEDQVWGALFVHSTQPEGLPADTEARLGGFTEVVATVMSKVQASAELRRLTDEQAALRRAATLVARGAAPPEVFATVACEVGERLGVDATHIGRYEGDDMAVVVGSWSRDGNHVPVDTRARFDGSTVMSLVRQTGEPARVEASRDYHRAISDVVGRDLAIRSSVGAPIVVEGRLWGAMIASSKTAERLAADAESRIVAFTELVATAISNAEARAEAGRLAGEQAAVLRVATLVARNVGPSEVWEAVADEVRQLLDADAGVGVLRSNPDGTVTLVARLTDLPVEVGTSYKVEEGESALAAALYTQRPARHDTTGRDTSALHPAILEYGIRTQVATPIVVEGRPWGAIVASWIERKPPPNAEERMAEITELVNTAISNAGRRAELAASRARLVEAENQERRRVVRELHDGAQQRLVYTVLTLKLAEQNLEPREQLALVTEALDLAERATAELRELSHGILPAVLARGGLRAGVDALASRIPVPVEIDLSIDRLPDAAEATGYFVVAEALTNVAKHARAKHAAVTARIENGALRVEVRDDGIGGARRDGRGLVRLRDRLAAVDGRLRIDSPTGGGTLVAAEIPISD